MGTLSVVIALTASCSLGGSGDPVGDDQNADECGPASLQSFFGELRFAQPTALLQHPTNATRWYVGEQQGVIWTFLRLADSTSTRRQFADLRDRVDASADEGGLLGVAFHPDFENRPEVFVSYTSPSMSAAAGFKSRVSRFESFDRGRTLELSSEKVFLEVDQPFDNHNGGHIAFGPDGGLYLGLGDGGAGGDPLGMAQNPETILGKMIRIDVDTEQHEIFASGLRNPWKFSFDQKSGALWAADVGQMRFEEVDIIERGKNYGWPIREGAHCFNEHLDCGLPGLTEPVAEYGRDKGISVTGGFVYRGERITKLKGKYVFADFGSGNVFAIDAERTGSLQQPELLFKVPINPSVFAQDSAGEIYVADFNTGEVFSLEAGGSCASFQPENDSAKLADEPATMTVLHREILSLRCSPCHTSRALGGLSMKDADVAFENLVNTPAETEDCAGGTRIVPGDSSSSVLFRKITGIDLCGPEMPPTGPLSEDEIAFIKRWIDAGAPR